MPKYVLTLDASQINEFGKCNLLWAYLYRENLRFVEADTLAMDKGSLCHLLLEHYYNLRCLEPHKSEKELIQPTIELFQKDDRRLEYKVPKDTQDFICQRFVQYVFNWMGRDFKPYIKEGRPATELGFSTILYENENVLFIIEGKIDLLIEVAEDVYAFVDHKSQSKENHLFNYRPQMLTYALATRYNYAMINYFGLQKEVKEKVTFRRDTIKITNWMIERHRKYLIEKVFTPIWMADIKLKGIYLKEKESNEIKFEPNYSNCAGSFDSSPCMFSRLCWGTEHAEMRENMKKFYYVKSESWSPWK
jgi:hypothetical protein